MKKRKADIVDALKAIGIRDGDDVYCYAVFERKCVGFSVPEGEPYRAPDGSVIETYYRFYDRHLKPSSRLFTSAECGRGAINYERHPMTLIEDRAAMRKVLTAQHIMDVLAKNEV